LAVGAAGVLVYSISFRYFVLFPEERELTVEPPAAPHPEPVLAGR